MSNEHSSLYDDYKFLKETIFSILLISDKDSGDDRTFYENIYGSDKWIFSNETGYNVIPTLTFSMKLESDKDILYKCVITQPTSFLNDKNSLESDKNIEMLMTNLIGILSVLSDESQNTICLGPLDMLLSNSIEYQIEESFLIFVVKDGYLLPMILSGDYKDPSFWENMN